MDARENVPKPIQSTARLSALRAKSTYLPATSAICGCTGTENKHG